MLDAERGGNPRETFAQEAHLDALAEDAEDECERRFMREWAHKRIEQMREQLTANRYAADRSELCCVASILLSGLSHCLRHCIPHCSTFGRVHEIGSKEEFVTITDDSAGITVIVHLYDDVRAPYTYIVAIYF